MALTDVRVLGCGQTAVGSLGTAQTELEQFHIVAGDHAVTCRIGGHQTNGNGNGEKQLKNRLCAKTAHSGRLSPGIVDQRQQCCLQQLCDDQRTFDLNDGNPENDWQTHLLASRETDRTKIDKKHSPRKHHRALLDGLQRDAVGRQLRQIDEELVLDAVGQRAPQILDVVGRVAEVLQELQALVQAGKDGELAVERVLAKVQIEDAGVGGFARLPVRVRHGDLVQVYEGVV